MIWMRVIETKELASHLFRHILSRAILIWSDQESAAAVFTLVVIHCHAIRDEMIPLTALSQEHTAAFFRVCPFCMIVQLLHDPIRQDNHGMSFHPFVFQN
jgi:hypothetical protein